MDRKPGRPRALTVEMIAEAALDDGLATFSMPSVARRLGVAHSGLYRYVINREGLLVHALDRAVSAWTWPPVDQQWDNLLRALGDSVWGLCDRYEGMDQVAVSLVAPSRAMSEVVQRHAAVLREAGFDEREARAGVEFVLWLAFSSSLLTRQASKLKDATTKGGFAFSSPVGTWACTGREAYEHKLDIALAGLSQRRSATTA